MKKKYALVILFALLYSLSANSQITELFISEYVEGSSSNKYLEIYNGTGANIDLSDYEIHLFSNGAATASTTSTLSGILNNGAVIVYQNIAATIYTGPATILPAINFNGDDAIGLYKISTGLYVDIFGNIGCDPGSAWTDTNTTLNRSLIRNNTVCGGITINPGGSCPFPTLSTEWTEFPQDDVSNLGSHSEVCSQVVDWGNLQFPGESSITTAGNETFFARVYEPGVTDPAGQGPGINVWIGYNTNNIDPSSGSWTWIPAAYNIDVGNNDEYSANISGLPSGTYYIASRFEFGNSGVYRYGGFNPAGGGFWDGTNNINSVLTIDQVDFCNLQFPEVGNIPLGNVFDVYARVYEPGVTDAPGQGAGIEAWIGYSTTNSDPSTWTNWVPAGYNLDIGNDDEYFVDIGSVITTPGTYYYASRFRLNGGAFSYGGIEPPNGGNFWDGVTYISGILNVQFANPPLMISQYYEGSGSNKWVEIKNVSNFIVPANFYYLVILNNADADNPALADPTQNGTPSFNKYELLGEFAVGEVKRFKEPATILPGYASPGEPGYDGNPTELMPSNSFSGDDIVMISSTNDNTTWTNRIDVIGDGTLWGDRRCFVRKECTASTPSITFDIDDWIEFTDAEVENPTVDTNPYLGQHFHGSTTFDGVGASGWTNGLPDRSRAVIIDDNYDTSVEGSFESCSLEITGGDTLDIQDGDYVGVVTDLAVNITGRLEIQNEGQLVMVEDSGIVTNDGTINVNKSTEVMQPFDYVYWSTPVDYASITPIPPPIAFILTEFNADHIYRFNTANFDDADGDFFDDDENDWSDFSSEMQNGVGYAAMTANTVAQSNSVQFSGRVNNGVITVPLSFSADSSADGDGDIDDWNLVGNPYPSAISADSLISQNASIDGTLYFWTHNDPISITNPGPDAENFNTDDYASYNSSGGVAASTGGSAPTGFIASGQGFFVDAVTATSIEFNNSMRNIAFANDDFFRSSIDNTQQKDRFWLNLTNPDGAFSQMLIAFFENATLNKDRLYDGIRLKNTNYLNIYSMDNTSYEYAIQGRPSFENSDIIPLGFSTHLYGPMEITLHQREGVLQNESIYLIDYYLNIIHDLTISPYTFTTETGTFNDRFAIAFVSDALSIEEQQVSSSDLVIYESDNDQVSFRMSNVRQIDKIEIIDLLGRRVYTIVGNNESQITKRLNTLNTGPYLAKVTLGNGNYITKKFIKK